MKKRVFFVICLCLAVSLGVLGSTLPAHGVGLIVSLDGSRTGDEGEAGGDRYLTSTAMTNATNVLLNAGFTINTTGSFLASNIAGASALYTGAVDTAFSANELTDIAAFVAGGGGLVIQRDWDNFYAAADPLAAIFGVTYNSTGVGIAGTPTAVNKIADSPIWDGPAGSVTTYDQIYSSSVSGATSLGVHSLDPTATALATLDYGLGRVVFLTDMDAWDDVGASGKPLVTTGSNNAIVWENIFEYASTGGTSVPEPAAVLLIGSGLAGLAGLRRKFRA